MKLDKSLSLISGVAIATILAVGGALTQVSTHALLRDSERVQIEDASMVLSTAMNQAATLSATHSEAIASDTRVVESMAAGDRRILLDSSRPLFQRLATSGGINVMHFHTPDMKSFLRVSEPENFGQDLSKFRPMVIAANHDKRTQKGLELGVKGLSLRAVSPIISDQGLVGTIEIGVELTSLLHLAKAATGADYALFLDPSTQLREDGTTSENRFGLTVEAATDATFFGTLQKADTVQLSRAPYVTSYSADGRQFKVMGRPLLDYSGNLIGVLVIARDFSNLESHLSRSVITVVAVSISGFLIAFSLFMIVTRAFITGPLIELALATAEDGGSDHQPLSHVDEYLQLWSAIRALQAKLRGAAENRGPAP
ncbi:hypothetical protein LJR030_003184 [Rhizobium sp. LjRoot30]|uniref:cache domain-containing protein n=1 Tax=Rhizobium sp. LjRoot30 TaxID=3342320 RepID=UPI003ECCB2DB